MFTVVYSPPAATPRDHHRHHNRHHSNPSMTQEEDEDVDGYSRETKHLAALAATTTNPASGLRRVGYGVPNSQTVAHYGDFHAMQVQRVFRGFLGSSRWHLLACFSAAHKDDADSLRVIVGAAAKAQARPRRRTRGPPTTVRGLGLGRTISSTTTGVSASPRLPPPSPFEQQQPQHQQQRQQQQKEEDEGLQSALATRLALRHLRSRCAVRLDDRDDAGYTLLMRAAEYAALRVVAALLDLGADLSCYADPRRQIRNDPRMRLCAGTDLPLREDRIAIASASTASMAEDDAKVVAAAAGRVDRGAMEVRGPLGCTALALSVLCAASAAAEAAINGAKGTGGTASATAAAASPSRAGSAVVATTTTRAGAEVNSKPVAVSPSPAAAAAAAASELAVAVVRLLLDAKADATQPMHDGQTALHVAAAAGALGLLSLIAESPATPRHALHCVDADGNSPLHLAAREGHDAVVAYIGARPEVAERMLVPRVASPPGWRPVPDVNFSSPSDSDGPRARAAPERVGGGYDIEARLPTDRNFGLNLRNDNWVTPLLVATAQGHLASVHSLLANGANVNAVSAQGVSSLAIAIEDGNLTLVKLLLQNGADQVGVPMGGRVGGWACGEVALCVCCELIVAPSRGKSRAHTHEHGGVHVRPQAYTHVHASS
jgi:ankyrin repeat protein